MPRKVTVQALKTLHRCSAFVSSLCLGSVVQRVSGWRIRFLNQAYKIQFCKFIHIRHVRSVFHATLNINIIPLTELQLKYSTMYVSIFYFYAYFLLTTFPSLTTLFSAINALTFDILSASLQPTPSSYHHTFYFLYTKLVVMLATATTKNVHTIPYRLVCRM